MPPRSARWNSNPRAKPAGRHRPPRRGPAGGGPARAQGPVPRGPENRSPSRRMPAGLPGRPSPRRTPGGKSRVVFSLGVYPCTLPSPPRNRREAARAAPLPPSGRPSRLSRNDMRWPAGPSRPKLEPGAPPGAAICPAWSGHLPSNDIAQQTRPWPSLRRPSPWRAPGRSSGASRRRHARPFRRESSPPPCLEGPRRPAVPAGAGPPFP